MLLFRLMEILLKMSYSQRLVLVILLCILLVASDLVFASTNNERWQIQSEESDKALIAYENGYKSYQKGQFNTADDFFTEAIKLEPNLVKAHYWLGKLYREQGRLNDAIFHWEEVERLNRLIKKRRVALSVQNNEYPSYSQMLEVAQEIKESKEAFVKGTYLLDKGHWDGAEVEFRKAVELHSGNHHYLVQMARLLWDKNELQASVKYYRDLLSKQSVTFKLFKEGFSKMIECNMDYVAKPLLSQHEHRFAEILDFKKMQDHFKVPKKFPIKAAGKIVERRDGQVILNIGMKDGLGLSDEFRLSMHAFRAGKLISDPDNGSILDRTPGHPTAELLLTKVYKNTSWALIRREYGYGVKAGDLIEFKKISR